MAGVNVNFFTWIREGVKQSVLLGVGDAIEQLGTPAETQDVAPEVLAFLRHDDDQKKLTSSSSNTRGRKRLGKSLKEIEPTQPND